MYAYNQILGKPAISRNVVVVFGILGLLAAYGVLSIVSAQAETSIAESISGRFIATSSGSYSYFVLNGSQAFDSVSLANRLLLYFDNLLSPLRIKEWAPLGYMAEVVAFLTGAEMPGFGPNPYFFVDGHFLFGTLGGLIYCFGLGTLISYIRRLQTNTILFYVLVKLVFYLPVDPGIAQSTIVALLFVAPIYGMVILLFQKYRKRRHAIQQNTVASSLT